MQLTKFKNHRNPKYLNWLRKQDCVIAGRNADVTHHVNMGTNSGKGIKASDYFCIPLLNEFHTTGIWAVHTIGEITFFKDFKLNRDELFYFFLSKFLKEVFSFEFIKNNEISLQENIYKLTVVITEFCPSPKVKKTKKVVVKKVLKGSVDFHKKEMPSVKVSSTEYYQKSKELKRQYDREAREKNKSKLSEYRKKQYQKNKAYQKELSALKENPQENGSN